jgi:hypothetical protein
MQREISAHSPLGSAVMRAIPFSVSFHARMRMFKTGMPFDAERLSIRGVALKTIDFI